MGSVVRVVNLDKSNTVEEERQRRGKVNIPGNTNVTREDLLGPIRGGILGIYISVNVSVKTVILLCKCPRPVFLHL